ncbi:restriction endonuclease, SacI family [Demequina sp.]|uniref:restriction endonuclease, SacI family n=1 Tax=Demequina sp. TaxID=2050685 RepID=UPI003D0DE0C9
MAHSPEGSDTWRLNLRQAEATIEAALAQRDADRANTAFIPSDWAHIAQEVFAWKGAKTYLAAVLCGLVARATDLHANPLSLQVGALDGGYAATSLWQTIQTHAQGRIDLRQLKNQPFNNSPFTGKRFISPEWENVSGANRPVLERTYELMATVGEMTVAEARDALRSFLYATPDDAQRGEIIATVAEGALNLERFFASLGEFLLDDGENGRRAQAMVAAALALVHGDSVDTPRSVNDPSRGQPGDVRVSVVGADGVQRALFAEAKQKVTEPEWIDQFAADVREYESGGVVAYGALVNDRAAAKSKRQAPLPSWHEVLESRGVISLTWTNPADMVRDAVVWSGLNANVAIARFVELYARYLGHVEAEPSTISNWLHVANGFGVETSKLEDRH